MPSTKIWKNVPSAFFPLFGASYFYPPVIRVSYHLPNLKFDFLALIKIEENFVDEEII